MNWQFKDDRPIYQQIIEQLESAVIKGEYKPGEKLPGVRELASQAGVNPNTMQRALAELESKGLLYTQRTNGRFVNNDKEKINSMRKELAQNLSIEYYAAMNALGYEKSEILKFIEEI